MQALIQQVKMSLDQNQNLNESAKESIFLIIQEMYHKMSLMGVSIPEVLLIEKLKNVSIEEGQKFINREIYEYKEEENKLVFSVDKIEEESQANVLCQALFAMSYIQDSKKPSIGIDGKQFAALLKGAFATFANHIIPYDGKQGYYEDEQIIVNLMNDLTNGTILEALLQDDNQKLEKSIQEHNLLIVNSYANYNLIAHPAGCKSQLGRIEKQIITQFFQQTPVVIRDQIETFKFHLVETPYIMSNPNQYDDLYSVKEFMNLKEQEYYRRYPDMNNVISMKPMSKEVIADVMELDLEQQKKSI